LTNRKRRCSYEQVNPAKAGGCRQEKTRNLALKQQYEQAVIKQKQVDGLTVYSDELPSATLGSEESEGQPHQGVQAEIP